MEEIPERWRNLSIEAEEEEVAGIDDSAIEEGWKTMRCGLLGKLLSLKPYNKRSF